ncbi:snRNA-activating protein complex subunit 1 isoform X2 [Lethenteron reissneri]|uniref:snRNA-activating protein complex subunit 1 isoform X2 n=1 Tax=Lethenteron reissneri TaxID=7753 RepID=UPI002AB5FEB4|nr:snRNA-activating protein complex subunit 1 isoform X2 [Lethenteron reissneri]
MAGAAGSRGDCEQLLDRFRRTDSVRYEDFAAVWRDMNFSLIHHGFVKDQDRKEFTEELILLASQYLSPIYSFQVRVGALYLLYAIYHTQLCQPRRKLMFRMGKMRKANIWKEKMNEHGGLRQNHNRVSGVVSTDAMEELQNIHEHYHHMKCAISTSKLQPDKSLSLVRDDMQRAVKDALATYQLWSDVRASKKPRAASTGKSTERNAEDKERHSYEEDDAVGCSRAEKLAAIKNKSYNNPTKAPRSRRHRQTEINSSEDDLRKHDSPRRKRPRSGSLTPRPAGAASHLADDCYGVEEDTPTPPSDLLSMPVIEEEVEGKVTAGTEVAMQPSKKRQKTK